MPADTHDDTRDDAHDLARFLQAQEGSHEAALAELRAGRKRSHWMWFVFPQLRGLGRSETARYFGIADGDEARRYLGHPVLGPRLTACAEAVLAHDDLSAEAIFGAVDALKLRSSATLFDAVGGPDVHRALIARHFDGPCPLTLARLEGRAG